MSFFVTKLESTYEVTKRFVNEKDELGSHKRKAMPFSRGKAMTIALKNMSEFKTFLNGLGTKDLVMVGHNESLLTYVATKKDIIEQKFGSQKQLIERSKENFPFSDGHGLLYIDYDPSLDTEKEEGYSKEVLLELIFDTIPELRNAPMLWKPSSGSCIWNIVTESWEVGVAGGLTSKKSVWVV